MHVSVIVPCHNGAAYLRAALDSVLRQTYAAAEVIVVDDRSTDGSTAIARSYGPPVTVVQGAYGGASAARLAGLDHAHTEADAYLFLDADDLLGRGALAALTATLDAHPGAVARCPWYRYERIHEAWHVRPPSCAPRRRGQDDLAAWLTGWYHPPCSVLWSRAAYERSGGWDPDVPVNNDGDLMMRALVSGVRLVPAQGGGEAFYRRHPGGGSLSATRHTPRGRQARRAVLDRIARRLDAQNRCARYAVPLAEAYRLVAGNAVPATVSATVPATVSASVPAVGSGVEAGPARTSVSMAGPADRPATPDDGGEGAPLVTVLIPTYNRPQDTIRAVQSVLAQTHHAVEVLVIDDASTDDTAAQVAALDDARLRVLRQPVNRGVAAARNRGLAEAQGAYVAFLDSDDVWMADKLRRQVEVMEAAPPHVGIVYTGTETHFEDGTVETFRPAAAGYLHGDLLARNILHGGGSSVLVRRAVVEAIGGFDTSLPAIEDWDYWIRAARLFEVAVVPEPLARYYDDRSQARRSRNVVANARARQMLYGLHRGALRAAGLSHRYQRESVHRILRDRAGWSAGGLRLILHILLHECREMAATLRQVLRGETGYDEASSR